MRAIAIITDEPGWHGAQLKRAFAARGYEGHYVSLTECSFDLSDPALVRIPGIHPALPLGVFVRGVPGGTLEQVILRLDVLHGLRELGVPVYNDARAIERTVDKALTSFLLKRRGVPTPDTWVIENEPAARALIARETAAGQPLVMKPLFGSQGLGITLIKDLTSLPDDLTGFGKVFYLQRFVESRDEEWRDWRVMVVGGRAIAVMQRRSRHWITNRAQGGRCLAVGLDRRLAQLAEASVRAIGIDYAGVDLLQDVNGEFLVTEVNSIPAWWGLQAVCGFNIAERLVADFCERWIAGGCRAAS